MLPAIREAVKGLLSRDNSKPITLDLKAGDVTFTPADWYQHNGFYKIAANSGFGSRGWAEEPVTLNSALGHSVIYACNKIISESVGFIPALMYREKGNTKQLATDHPMYSALKNAPNEEITAQAFTEMLTGHCVMSGGAFAKINRRTGKNKTAIDFTPLTPEMVTVDREKDGARRLVYSVKTGNDAAKTYTVKSGEPQDILHIRGFGWDGTRGYSVLKIAVQSFSTAQSIEKHVGKFYARGGRVPYNLKLNKEFKDPERETAKFRADWKNVYDNAHETPLLPPWIDYEKTGLTAQECQMIETRAATVSELCRWFSVSPYLVGDLSRATNNNIEQLALEFIQRTLMSWLTRWEQELWRCVLTPEEKGQGFLFKHNLKALLRGDFASRMAGYATALQNGYMNVDEVRADEDMNPLADDIGKDYHIQLNMQTLPTADNPQLIKLGSNKK